MDKNFLKISAFAFFLITLAVAVHGEMSIWSNQLMNNVSEPSYPSTVQDHIFYQFEDTSIEGTGRNKAIPIEIYYVIQPLPYSLGSYGGSVDSCELILRHFRNIYDSDGNRINTTLEYTNLNFSTNASADSGVVSLDMKSDDTLSGDIYCHYTNVSTLYADNILVGRFTTFFPSFECKGCSDNSLESLTNELETLDERLTQQSITYSVIQGIMNIDFSIWLILKWLITLSFFFVALGLLFYSVYFIYSMIKNLERTI